MQLHIANATIHLTLPPSMIGISSELLNFEPLVPTETQPAEPGTALTPPAHGDYWPGQGGMLAAILRGPTVDGIEQPPYALLVSDAAAGEIENVTWGEYGKDVPGASSRTDGKANTDAMVLASCPAALRVRELTIEGHSDWYLPSLGELNSAAANAPELFSTDDYWTSSQDSRDYAFVQDFEDGYSYWCDKDYERRVRAVRAIPLDALNT